MTTRFALLAGAVVLLAGCASVTSGTGSARTSATAPSSVPNLSSTPATPSASVPVSGVPSGSGAPSDSGAPAAGCSPAPDYCDDFSSGSSGWPVENTALYYANYSPYRGGTYRMGERTANGKTQIAPVDTTTISDDYGVQIDVDAVLGKSAPAGSYIGVVCWHHKTSDGAEAGMLVVATADSVDVTLLPDDGGQPRALDRTQGAGFLRPYPATNHLTATCMQRRTGAGTEADLSAVVNGASVLHEEYAKSVKNYPWSPGSQVGLVVAGAKSDVLFDNFSVTGK